MLLNGGRLETAADGERTSMDPIVIPGSSPVDVAPLSIIFQVFRKMEAEVCGQVLSLIRPTRGYSCENNAENLNLM